MRKVLKQALLLILGLVNFSVFFVVFRQCLTWSYLVILGGNWWCLVVLSHTW